MSKGKEIRNDMLPVGDKSAWKQHVSESKNKMKKLELVEKMRAKIEQRS